MDRPLRILYLEDSEMDLRLAEAALQRAAVPFELFWAKGREDYLALLMAPNLDLVLSDFSLPDFEGMAALESCRRIHPLLPFILVSGYVGEEVAVECLRRGATDYVLKGNLRRLPMVVRRAMEEVEERRARARAEEEKASLLEAASIAKVVPWKQEIPSRAWVFGDSATLVLGYSPTEFRTLPDLVESLIHTEDIHRFFSARTASQGGRAVGFDCRMRHKCGGWLWTRWTLGHSPERFRGVLQDVSELHATQEQLIQSQKAETVGVLVSGLCHDFSNLLMAISGAAEMLAMQDIQGNQRKSVATIQRAAGRSRDLLRQLLRFARKNQEPKRARQDLNDLVKEAEGLLRNALRREVDLDARYSEEPVEAFVDPGQIVQILMNLGINAQDAISGSGTITLRTGRQALGLQEAEAHDRPPGMFAAMEVEDTGSGIPPEFLAKIFDPFFTTKPPGKGTGLGLAMVHAIVKGHDGILECHSEPGMGTRFRILLPLASLGLEAMVEKKPDGVAS